MIAVIYENGKEIDRGILIGGKHYTTEDPSQFVYICDSADAYNITNERRFDHNKSVYFEEFQNERMVYSSIEKVDRSINYPLPSWLFSNEPIPNFHSEINGNRKEESEFKGYI